MEDVRDIPPNYVEVEIIIGDDGEVEAQILRHGPNTSCTHQNDKKLLSDFFDDKFEVEDMKHTEEYYEETKPQSYEAPQQPQKEKKKKEKQRIDMGYGV